MTKPANCDYVVLDWKKERFIKIVDPNLRSREDFSWVVEAESTRFPDSTAAFEAWKMLKKLKIPNMRITPVGWKH